MKFTKQEEDIIREKLFDSQFYINGDKFEDTFLKYLHYELTKNEKEIKTKIKRTTQLLGFIRKQVNIKNEEIIESQKNLTDYNTQLLTIQSYLQDYNNTMKGITELPQVIKSWGIKRLSKYNS